MDIQQACVEEAALLQRPVCALKARLAQLLAEWPDHPVLVQLLAICDRLTGNLPSHLFNALHKRCLARSLLPDWLTFSWRKSAAPVSCVSVAIQAGVGVTGALGMVCLQS